MITNLFTTDKKKQVYQAQAQTWGLKKSSTFLSAGRPTVNDKRY